MKAYAFGEGGGEKFLQKCLGLQNNFVFEICQNFQWEETQGSKIKVCGWVKLFLQMCLKTWASFLL